MNPLRWLARKFFGAPAPIRAKYDAAQTTAENRRHWANADGLDAASANSREVRARLRSRARYEVANNSYAKGIVLTLANDLIGTGPRLQLQTESPEFNTALESLWAQWSDRIGLAAKLRTLHAARITDGEAFGVITSNPALGDLQLDFRLIECDRVSDATSGDEADGIRYDQWGNPVEYSILDTHPGSSTGWSFVNSTVAPASAVCHWFRIDRPGQLRGVPDITPALPLFAQLRRYTLAVIAAAETAADFAAVIYSEAKAEDAEDYDGVPPEIEIERRVMTTLPRGWKMGQFRAEHPTATYSEFKGEILAEIARCLNIPFNVAAGNSSSYNYASGRLDFQVYFKALSVERSAIERTVLDPLFREFLREVELAGLIAGPIPETISLEWFWDGSEHVDPKKEADAQAVRLANHTTTLADECARRGADWEAVLRQRAREVELMESLGLVVLKTPEGKSYVEDNSTNNDDEEPTRGAGRSSRDSRQRA